MRSHRSFALAGLAAAALALPLLGAPAAAAPASTVPAAVHTQAVTLHFDDSGSAEFKQAVEAAAQVWNQHAKNVQLVPGSPADFTVTAYDGWPETMPESLGHGTIQMGREAVNEGFDVTRIAAHEMGHILGLPDNRTGLCSDLMSGHSAPTSCTNAVPSDAELAQVEQNFAGSAAAPRMQRVYVDGPAARPAEVH